MVESVAEGMTFVQPGEGVWRVLGREGVTSAKSVGEGGEFWSATR